MPGEHHEILVELLREAPEALAVLLRERGVPLPRRGTVVPLERSARQLRPVEFDADLVLRFARGRQRVTVIVEVQRSEDDEKLRRWPLYFSHLRTKVRSRVVLVVVATNRRVAEWARAPIVDEDGEFVFTPRVFGPDDVAVLDAEAALAQPALAMLSALVHLEHEDRVAIAARAVLAWAAVDVAAAGVYFDALKAELGAVDGERLEETVMGRTHPPYRSDFGKKHYEAGLAEGEVRGEAKGIVHGEAEALLVFLRARGLRIDTATERRIRACRDADRLREWIERAVHVQAASELFVPGDDA